MKEGTYARLQAAQGISPPDKASASVLNPKVLQIALRDIFGVVVASLFLFEQTKGPEYFRAFQRN
jgi:hypothetical protein